MSDAKDKSVPSSSDTVHGDRRLGVEHGAIHKPIHTSVQYGYERTEDLIGVFQGTLKNSFSYARQGTPTTAALEAKLTQLEQGLGDEVPAAMSGRSQRADEDRRCETDHDQQRPQRRRPRRQQVESRDAGDSDDCCRCELGDIRRAGTRGDV